MLDGAEKAFPVETSRDDYGRTCETLRGVESQGPTDSPLILNRLQNLIRRTYERNVAWKAVLT